MKTHYTIPIFIPEKACPFRCVYCNQYHIADTQVSPNPENIKTTIDAYLQTMPLQAHKRIAFFGGSFTGMTITEQNRYLEITKPYVEKGAVEGIQLSTRPDYITKEILDNLKHYHIKIIELGAQSLDDEVLLQAGRGHGKAEVEMAARMIREQGFELGLQMMIGLPGDSYEKAMLTAEQIIEWGAKYTRIYPTLVIKDTLLADWYDAKQYIPLRLEEAISWSKDLMKLFEKHGLIILRMGLHPSEGLINGTNLIAGPFHVSFKELVMNAIWKEKFMLELGKQKGEAIVIKVHPSQLNAAIGYQKQNKNNLLMQFKTLTFLTEDTLSEREFSYTIH